MHYKTLAKSLFMSKILTYFRDFCLFIYFHAFYFKIRELLNRLTSNFWRQNMIRISQWEYTIHSSCASVTCVILRSLSCMATLSLFRTNRVESMTEIVDFHVVDSLISWFPRWILSTEWCVLVNHDSTNVLWVQCTASPEQALHSVVWRDTARRGLHRYSRLLHVSFCHCFMTSYGRVLAFLCV